MRSREAQIEIALGAIMSELLADRRYQRVWIDELALALASSTADAATSPICGLVKTKKQEEDARMFALAVDRLVVGVEMGIETFLRAQQFAVHLKDNPTAASDAAALYSVRVQLYRFIAVDRDVRSQMLLLIRRLGHLVRTFTIRVSSAFDIARAAFFVSSLCEMLFRLEEFLDVHHVEPRSSKRLRYVTNELYMGVAKPLNKLNTSRRHTTALDMPLQRTDAAATPSSAFAMSRAVVFRPAFSDTRPRSFLISPELAAARAQNERRRRRRSASGSAAATPALLAAAAQTPTRPLIHDTLENRWMRLLATNNTPTALKQDQEALRVACEITREVVDNLEHRVLRDN